MIRGQDHSELAKRARETGKNLEDAIIAACDVYREECIADIVRCRPAGHEKPLSVKLRGISEVDFDGDMLTSDKRVAFDTKSISKNSSYSHAVRDRHQIAFLMRLQARGHLAFILLYDHNLDMMWLVMDVRRLIAPPEWITVRTIDNGVIRSYLPVVERKNGVWDFLPVAHAEHDRLFGSRV